MVACIKFAKTKQCATIPMKREEDAAWDLWSAEAQDTVLPPHQVVMVDTGIATAFDPDWVAIIKERSGHGSKGVAVRAGVIDSGYRNSWKVCLMNMTDEEIVIPYTKAIAQFIMVPVPNYDWEEYDYDELIKIESKRGLGGFGSTDK